MKCKFILKNIKTGKRTEKNGRGGLTPNGAGEGGH